MSNVSTFPPQPRPWAHVFNRTFHALWTDWQTNCLTKANKQLIDRIPFGPYNSGIFFIYVRNLVILLWENFT
jgi:hypothetical protein